MTAIVSLTDIAGDAVLPFVPAELAKLLQQVEDMTGAQLDDWYMKHVGYRVLNDDPHMSPQAHAALVAGAMYARLYEGDDLPEDFDTHCALINRYFRVPQPA